MFPDTFLTVPVLTELKHEASGAGEYSSDRKPLTSPARAICIGGDYSCHLASPSPLMQVGSERAGRGEEWVQLRLCAFSAVLANAPELSWRGK